MRGACHFLQQLRESHEADGCTVPSLEDRLRKNAQCSDLCFERVSISILQQLRKYERISHQAILLFRQVTFYFISRFSQIFIWDRNIIRKQSTHLSVTLTFILRCFWKWLSRRNHLNGRMISIDMPEVCDGLNVTFVSKRWRMPLCSFIHLISQNRAQSIGHLTASS